MLSVCKYFMYIVSFWHRYLQVQNYIPCHVHLGMDTHSTLQNICIVKPKKTAMISLAFPCCPSHSFEDFPWSIPILEMGDMIYFPWSIPMMDDYHCPSHIFEDFPWSPPVNIQKAMENGPVEIVDFPNKNGGSFHGKMLVHQRVITIKSHYNPIKIPLNHHFPMVFLWFLNGWCLNPNRSTPLHAAAHCSPSGPSGPTHCCRSLEPRSTADVAASHWYFYI